jgi:hypothetical protein
MRATNSPEVRNQVEARDIPSPYQAEGIRRAIARRSKLNEEAVRISGAQHYGARHTLKGSTRL